MDKFVRQTHGRASSARPAAPPAIVSRGQYPSVGAGRPRRLARPARAGRPRPAERVGTKTRHRTAVYPAVMSSPSDVAAGWLGRRAGLAPPWRCVIECQIIVETATATTTGAVANAVRRTAANILVEWYSDGHFPIGLSISDGDPCGILRRLTAAAEPTRAFCFQRPYIIGRQSRGFDIPAAEDRSSECAGNDRDVNYALWRSGEVAVGEVAVGEMAVAGSNPVLDSESRACELWQLR